ncbi:NAD(P)-binding domain-containing protein [Mangrovicoccus sp. HB161399]|uniref:NAD(P)-binding domain-containing protein n=1 Tax=Mangrovicoccus sp. HB161399 TaxID=2720392 RepID=UPI001557853D
MKSIHTLVIGAGQAGLAASRCLSERGIEHVVLERGEIANSWRHERWDSLRLLTPNWQSRLPGHAHGGPDPDGFMAMPEVVRFLEGYAALGRAPVEERTRVTRVRRIGGGYSVETDRGGWACRNLILATGACNAAKIPACAAALPSGIAQLTPLGYRNPAQLAPGGVLVVGASATGVQLAAEIRAAGHEVTLAAGAHVRVPRWYRGRDIQRWMDCTGLHDTPAAEVDDLARVRRLPSLQLAGDGRRRFLDLSALRAAGVEIAGRLAAIRDGQALFSGGLANDCALADLKMNRLLGTIDAWIGANEPGPLPPPERFAPTAVPERPRLVHDLAGGRFRTVIWATGFRPDFGWLDLPVFDAKGALRHEGGHVLPGLYVLGLPFLRRRNSALIDGVGADAAHVAAHILETRGRLAA